jgi:glycosyltransferase involved in cell wall biosynthesis
MMKLFVISHSYSGDGASQMLTQAASHWTKRLGWQIDAVIVPGMPAEAHQAIADSGMIPVQRAYFGKTYDFALINCLKNISFVDLIYPHVPSVLWAHEAETVLQSTSFKRERWESWFAKVSLLIFQTDWQSRLYRKYTKHLDQMKIAIVPNGIPPIPEPGQGGRTGDDLFRIVSVGKLTPLKAQADLIRAVACLSSAYPVHCELTGGTEYLPGMDHVAQEVLAKHPHLFTLSGALPRAQALARVEQADLFCFPSKSESFGLAPLEAAALGVPVILADLTPYRAIGWVSGKNCLTFPAGDRNALQSAIEAAIRVPHLREKIAAGGKELAAKYGMEQFLSAISERMLQVVNQNL